MTNRCGRVWKVQIGGMQRVVMEPQAGGLAHSTTDAATMPQLIPPPMASALPSAAAARTEDAQSSIVDPAQSTVSAATGPSDSVEPSNPIVYSSRSETIESGSAAGAAASKPQCVRIGVLALQGAFIEHIACLERLAPFLRVSRGIDLQSSLVRTAAELAACHGLILPGGESTAMRRLLSESSTSPSGLLPALQSWVAADRPVFGTCAGSIMLADRIVAAPPPASAAAAASTPTLAPVATDHTAVPSSLAALGGIDMTLARNYFGRQLASFESAGIRLMDEQLRSTRVPVPTPSASASEKGTESAVHCAGVFIRAPAILQLGPSVRVLATLPHADTHRRHSEQADAGVTPSTKTAPDQAVAVRSGRRIATCFHPELTNDLRWHAYFVDIGLSSLSPNNPSQMTQ